FHAMPARLIAQAILTVDTIGYSFDQSTEDPGNNSPYLLTFPEVAEDIMPGSTSSNGASLVAFTVGQTQTLHLNWTKNHPWGYEPNTYVYDSTLTHITLFIQDSATHYVYQAASIAEGHSFTTAIRNLTNSGSIVLYPNP